MALSTSEEEQGVVKKPQKLETEDLRADVSTASDRHVVLDKSS